MEVQKMESESSSHPQGTTVSSVAGEVAFGG